MIGKLNGQLIQIENNRGLINTSSGVGYNVFLTPNFLSRHHLEDSISIFTYLQVRDDAMVLFGFETKIEENFFRLLLTVSGVGPKTAFNVISSVEPKETIQAIKNNDIIFFSKVHGLGKKTAMKIILELSQKLKEEFSLEKMYLTSDDKTVVDALVSLGYKSYEAKKLLQKIPKDLSIEEKIKFSLKLK